MTVEAAAVNIPTIATDSYAQTLYSSKVDPSLFQYLDDPKKVIENLMQTRKRAKPAPQFGFDNAFIDGLADFVHHQIEAHGRSEKGDK